MTNGHDHGSEPFGYSTGRFDKPEKESRSEGGSKGCALLLVMPLLVLAAIAEVWRVVA